MDACCQCYPLSQGRAYEPHYNKEILWITSTIITTILFMVTGGTAAMDYLIKTGATANVLNTAIGQSVTALSTQ